MVCKVRKHRTVLFTKNKESSYIQMLSSEIVNLSTGFRSPSKDSLNPSAKHEFCDTLHTGL